MKKKTEDDYRQLAQGRGHKWISRSLPPNTNVPTEWQCSRCGYEWMTSYTGLRGCPKCAGLAPRTASDYRALAEERKPLQWIGELPPNTRTPTKWRCGVCGYEWMARYSSIQSGSGCPDCAGNLPRVATDYNKVTAGRNFEWVGELPANARDVTRWRCSACGHEWMARYDDIRSGSGCPDCAGNLPRTTDDYGNLAAKRDCFWTGPEVTNIQSPTGWRCYRGHEWTATYGNVYSGTGCPVCRESRGEREIAQLLNLLGVRYLRQRRFRKCKAKRMLPFDFSLTLFNRHFLIEYDGNQHFEPVDRFGGMDGLRERQRRDAIKTDFAQEYGFDLIRVPYTVDDIGSYLVGEICRITGKSYEEVVFRKKRSDKPVVIDFDNMPAEGFQLRLLGSDDLRDDNGL